MHQKRHWYQQRSCCQYSTHSTLYFVGSDNVGVAVLPVRLGVYLPTTPMWICRKELIDWVKALIYTIQWRKLKKWIWSQLVEMEDVWVLKYQVVRAHFFLQTLIASEISSRDLRLSKLIFNCANFRLSPVFEINVCKRKWFNWQKSLRALSFGYWAKSLHVSFRCAYQCYRSTAFFSFNT